MRESESSCCFPAKSVTLSTSTRFFLRCHSDIVNNFSSSDDGRFRCSGRDRVTSVLSNACRSGSELEETSSSKLAALALSSSIRLIRGACVTKACGNFCTKDGELKAILSTVSISTSLRNKKASCP